MRIRDWSSDVCSSDLLAYPVEGAAPGAPHAAGLTRILLDDMIALLGEAVDAKHDALAAKVAGEVLDQLRMFQRRGIDGYLVGPSSEGRRVGQGCCSNGRSRGSPYHLKKHKQSP